MSFFKDNLLTLNPILRRFPRNEKDWEEFVRALDTQYIGVAGEFTPTWTGFSSDPSGDISYVDFGSTVILFTASVLTGTSNANSMTITNLPEDLRPASGVRLVPCLVNSANSASSNITSNGYANVQDSGTITFAIAQTQDPTDTNAIQHNVGGFHTSTANKGIPAGWLIRYPK